MRVIQTGAAAAVVVDTRVIRTFRASSILIQRRWLELVEEDAVLDDVGVRGLMPRGRTVVKRPLVDVASADTEVERPLTGLNAVDGVLPAQFLALFGECVPDALERNGLVAGQGEPGASESAFDRHEYVLSCEGNVDRATLGHFRRHLVGEVEAGQVVPQSSAPAEEDRGDHEVQVVDQAGA